MANPLTLLIVAVVLLALLGVSEVFRRRASASTRRLAESSALLELVLSNISEGVIVMDRHRDIQFLSKTATGLLSLDSTSTSYTQVEDQFECVASSGDILPLEQWASARALRGDFVKELTVVYRNKRTGVTGSRWISTAPVPNTDGAVLVVYRDDTERHRIDEDRIRLAAIVESCEDAIISKDPSGSVLTWNKGAEKIFGYTAAEMVGHPITQLLPPDRLEEETDILQRILRDETVDNFDTRRVTKDGRTINVSLTISPIKDAAGTIVGASKIARDITAIRNLEAQLRQSQKMEALGQLTGGIAHDFNNLLSIIIGNLDLLEEEVQVEVADRNAGTLKIAATLRHTKTARRAATRAAELTRRLLGFSSSEQLRPAATNIEHSIRNVLEMATRSLGPEIFVSTNFEKAIPTVFVDTPGLETALLNLIVNARDAMPGGGSLRISAQLSHLDDNLSKSTDPSNTLFVCISLSDNGSGMSPEVLQRAFDPFFTTKPRGQGTGLGLAMVYGFLKQSKGTARIYSEPGYGTTVSLYLPVDVEIAVPIPIELHTQRPAKFGATVLLVDDEPGILDIASDYLARIGYNTLQAIDGPSALEVVSAHPEIDLIVTDIIMPGGMNGVELAQKILKLRPTVKIIYSSGFPSDALAQKKFNLPATTLLNKPYRLAELGSLVHNLIGQPVEA